MMTCRNYEEWISVYLDGGLTKSERAELMEHMAACRGCQRYFDDLVAIHAAMMEDEEVPVPAGFAEQVMKRVRVTEQVKPPKVIPVPWRRWAALAACCAFVVFGAWWFQSKRGVDLAAGQDMVITLDTAPRMARDADMPAAADDGVMVMMDEDEALEDGSVRTADSASGGAAVEAEDAAEDQKAATEYARETAKENAPVPSPAASTWDVAGAPPVNADRVTEQAMPAASGSLGLLAAEDAQAAALEHAGLAAGQVNFSQAKLEWEDGRQVYDVEFYTASAEYDYEIDAATGEIVKFDYDAETVAFPAPEETAGASITQDAAREIALANVPGAAAEHVVKLELDRDDGRAVYEVEIVYGGMEYELEIDAADGAVLDFEAEPVDD